MIDKYVIVTFYNFQRRSKGKGAPAKLDSDDEDAFRNEPVPDSQNDDFYYDDIDQFHTERDKVKSLP